MLLFIDNPLLDRSDPPTDLSGWHHPFGEEIASFEPGLLGTDITRVPHPKASHIWHAATTPHRRYHPWIRRSLLATGPRASRAASGGGQR